MAARRQAANRPALRLTEEVIFCPTVLSPKLSLNCPLTCWNLCILFSFLFRTVLQQKKEEAPDVEEEEGLTGKVSVSSSIRSDGSGSGRGQRGQGQRQLSESIPAETPPENIVLEDCGEKVVVVGEEEEEELFDCQIVIEEDGGGDAGVGGAVGIGGGVNEVDAGGRQSAEANRTTRSRTCASQRET